jgi:hypothetical protein
VYYDGRMETLQERLGWFGAAARSQAIEHAVEIGLLESTIYPPRAHFTREG